MWCVVRGVCVCVCACVILDLISCNWAWKLLSFSKNVFVQIFRNDDSDVNVYKYFIFYRRWSRELALSSQAVTLISCGPIIQVDLLLAQIILKDLRNIHSSPDTNRYTHTYIQKIKKLFPLPLLFTINFAIYSFFFDTQRVLPMALGKLVRGISNCFVYETLLWASLSLYNNSNQYIMLWLEELVTPGDPPSLIRTPPPAVTPSETIQALAGFI